MILWILLFIKVPTTSCNSLLLYYLFNTTFTPTQCNRNNKYKPSCDICLKGIRIKKNTHYKQILSSKGPCENRTNPFFRKHSDLNDIGEKKLRVYNMYIVQARDNIITITRRENIAYLELFGFYFSVN